MTILHESRLVRSVESKWRDWVKFNVTGSLSFGTPIREHHGPVGYGGAAAACHGSWQQSGCYDTQGCDRDVVILGRGSDCGRHCQKDRGRFGTVAA